MAEKEVTMKLKVDVQCKKCMKKVEKVLRKFPEIQDKKIDEKQNLVIIKVVCFDPEKIRDKICCKSEGSIKTIEILPEKKPQPDPPKPQPDPPKPKPDPPKPKPPPPAIGYPPQLIEVSIGTCYVSCSCFHCYHGRRSACSCGCHHGRLSECNCGCHDGRPSECDCGCHHGSLSACNCGCNHGRPSPCYCGCHHGSGACNVSTCEQSSSDCTIV